GRRRWVFLSRDSRLEITRGLLRSLLLIMRYTDGVRLADSTAIEPLINSFPLWADTISPVPYSLHLVNYQMKTLSSYVANPEMHRKAVRNPKFSGGPFVDVPPERAGEVKEILERIEASQGDNIDLARAVVDFNEYLSREAKGQSLEPYYDKTPAALLGYVE